MILVSEKLGSAGTVFERFALFDFGLWSQARLTCTSHLGLELLNQFGVADCSYDLTPEQLCEKVKNADALIVRSATKVLTFMPQQG